MKPPDRNRTTSTPGMVDRVQPRRSSAEVTLEKKKRSDAANARAQAKRLAAVRVTEIESMQKKGNTTSTPNPKQPRKRPLTGASRDVSVLDRQSSKPLAQVTPSYTGGLLGLWTQRRFRKTTIECTRNEEEGRRAIRNQYD